MKDEVFKAVDMASSGVKTEEDVARELAAQATIPVSFSDDLSPDGPGRFLDSGNVDFTDTTQESATQTELDEPDEGNLGIGQPEVATNRPSYRISAQQANPYTDMTQESGMQMEPDEPSEGDRRIDQPEVATNRPFYHTSARQENFYTDTEVSENLAEQVTIPTAPITFSDEARKENFLDALDTTSNDVVIKQGVPDAEQPPLYTEPVVEEWQQGTQFLAAVNRPSPASTLRTDTFQTDENIRDNLTEKVSIPSTVQSQIQFSEDAARTNFLDSPSASDPKRIKIEKPNEEPPQVDPPVSAADIPAPVPEHGVRRSNHAGKNRVTRRIERSVAALASAQEDDYESMAAQQGTYQVVTDAKITINAAGTTAQSVWRIGHDVVDAAEGMEKPPDLKEVFSAGADMLKKEGVNVGGSIAKTATHAAIDRLENLRTQSDDFADNVPVAMKDVGFAGVHAIAWIKRALQSVVTHPKRTLLLLFGTLGLLILLAICNVASSSSSTIVTTMICTEQVEDLQRFVTYLNEYRNNAIMDEIYMAFRGETDPNRNPYGYRTLTGRKSDNMLHGVTWNYANGIANDTAEIISLAAVYFQQQWPPSSAFSTMEGYTLFDYCRALTAYGLDVVATESHPYSCLTYGGCVKGYRSEGESVTIKDYRLETHSCAEDGDECGDYNEDGSWEWNYGHSAGNYTYEWVEDGEHEVTVFFPIVFPDTANNSPLCVLPENAVKLDSSTISAEDCTGNIVLPNNLYTGIPGDWFYTPGDFSASFTVEQGEGETKRSDVYRVDFENATAIPWCPGELHDGQYGHYDLNCTIYLTGYDSYADPETQSANGDAGGAGNLVALAHAVNDGSLTRQVVKQNQQGVEYTGNATASRYTRTVTLPAGAAGFTHWYDATDTDVDGNVAWAEILYKMDWEELYHITDGIKCRTVGAVLNQEELDAILAELGLDGENARAQVVAFALACQGRFTYEQPTSLRGGPGAPSVGANLDCSSFVRYCYWALGLPFSAGNTSAYASAGDLIAIDPSTVEPGDLRVVYARGEIQGHVQMYVGGGSWIECCYGYGVGLNYSNGFMTSHPCYYFTYAGF